MLFEYQLLINKKYKISDLIMNLLVRAIKLLVLRYKKIIFKYEKKFTHMDDNRLGIVCKRTRDAYWFE